MPLARTWGFALALVAAMGCNSKPIAPTTTEPDSGAADAGPAAACAALAAAHCSMRSQCTNGSQITHLFGDMGTCLTRTALQCTVGASAPSTGQTIALIEQCAQALLSLSCADYLAANYPAACIPVGSLAAGTPCSVGSQCASTYCDDSRTSACGTCGDAPAVGSDCLSTSCARGQSCTQTFVCAQPGAIGASCQNDVSPCGSDLACAASSATAMGTCSSTIADAGGACGGTAGLCDFTQGLTCLGAPGSKACIAIDWAPAGSLCGNLDGGGYQGCLAGDCFTDAGAQLAGQEGTCKSAAMDGQPCDAVLGPNCLSPARCVLTTGGSTAGICTLPSGNNCG